MDLQKERYLVYLVPIVVFIIIFAFNSFAFGPPMNRAMALTSIILLGITFIIGPLGKFSKTANRMKAYRKYLGLSAFAFIVVHAFLSLAYNFDFDIGYMLSGGTKSLLQVYSAWTAFAIFLLMSVTSTTKAIKLLGGRNWKLLQSTGYVAMALAMLHFMLANTYQWVFNIGRLYAELVFAFGILVILVRLAVLVLVFFEKSSKNR